MKIKFYDASMPNPVYDGFLVRYYYLKEGETTPNYFDAAVPPSVFFGWSEYSTDQKKFEMAETLFAALERFLHNYWDAYHKLPDGASPITPADGLKFVLDQELQWKDVIMTFEDQTPPISKAVATP